MIRAIAVAFMTETDRAAHAELLRVASAVVLQLPLTTAVRRSDDSDSPGTDGPFDAEVFCLMQAVLMSAVKNSPFNTDDFMTASSEANATSTRSDVPFPEVRTAISTQGLTWMREQCSKVFSITRRPLVSIDRALKARAYVIHGHSETGANDGGGSKTQILPFCEALGYLAVRSRTVPPADAHGAACRTSLSAIVEQYHLPFVNNSTWAVRYMHELLDSSAGPERQLGTKLLTTMLTLSAAEEGAADPDAAAAAYLLDLMDCPVPLAWARAPDCRGLRGSSVIVRFDAEDGTGLSSSSSSIGVLEVVALLLKSASDTEHAVRSQAIVGLGSLPAVAWRLLRATDDGRCRVAAVDCMLSACGDSMGAVRVSAHRAFSDAVGAGALLTTDVATAAAAVSMAQQTVLRGCADTKLAVRVQATAALSSLVVFMLPARQLVASEDARSPPLQLQHHEDATRLLPEVATAKYECVLVEALARGAQAHVTSSTSGTQVDTLQWATDETWLSLCEAVLVLAADSEKVLAAAARCLGLLCAGLRPDSPTHLAMLSRILQTLVDRVLLSTVKVKRAVASGLIQRKDSLREDALGIDVDGMEWFNMGVGYTGAGGGTGLVGEDVDVGVDVGEIMERLRRHVERCAFAVAPKLVFSVCHALGHASCVLTRSGSNVSPAAKVLLGRLVPVLCALQRFSRPKVQLQATKALISLSEAGAVHGSDATMILESTMVTTANYVYLMGAVRAVNGPSPGEGHGRAQTVISAGAGDDVDEQHTSFLQRALLVLLWSLLCRAHAISRATLLEEARDAKGLATGNNMHYLECTRQIIMHHADATSEWLDFISAGDASPIRIPLLSMTLPPLASTVPECSLGTSIAPQELVHRLVVHLLGVLHIDATCDADVSDPRMSALHFTSAHLAMTATSLERLRAFVRLPSAPSSPVAARFHNVSREHATGDDAPRGGTATTDDGDDDDDDEEEEEDEI